MPTVLAANRIRFLLAVATALAGVMNIVSTLFPAFHWRYLLLRDMVPTRLINDSNIATVLFGILLILLADGLSKRHRRAMWLTLGVLSVSAALHLTKGLDYEEALICLGLAALLFARRGDYQVASRPLGIRTGVGLAAGFALLYYAYDLLGFRLLDRWITPRPTFLGALLEPWRLVFDTRLYHYHGYQAHWFGTSLVLLGCAAVAFATVVLLRPLIPVHASSSADRARARAIVRAHGHDTLSYFSLRDDRRYFFDETGKAFLSYRIWRNVALVGGDPIGPSRAVGDLIEEFLEFSQGNALIPAFLGTNGRNLSTYRDMGLRVLKIGEESVIRLADLDVASLKRKVRRAERHCLELGMSATIYPASQLPAAYREQAMQISKRWVKAKGGAERGFSMTLGRFPRRDDLDARVLVAAKEGEVAGFLTFVPVFGSGSWSLDMMRRKMDAPNGLTEFMVLQAARMLQNEGADFMSLNFASLSSTEACISEPRAVASLRRFIFDNLSSMYQLKTLYSFNAKFEPEWSSRYLVYGSLMRAGKVIMAVVQAEDPIKLSTLAGVLKRP
jgi:lysylphosphatidylglycerol synthetase-like protein (DUF2156 family)